MKLNFLILLLFSTSVLAETKLSPHQLAERIKNFEQTDILRPSIPALHQMKVAYALKDVTHREWSLYQILKKHPVDNLTSESLLWLQQLSFYKSETKSWLSDGGYKIDVTPWPIAAQAKGIIRRWEIVQSKNMAVTKLSEGNWKELLTFDKKTQQLGIMQTISESPIDEIIPLAENIYNIKQPTTFELQLLWNISQKTKTILWMKKVILLANKSFSTSLMKQQLKTAELNQAKQLELIKEALKNPHMVSFALLKLSDFVKNNREVQQLLLSYLDDKNLGGSAARALSGTRSLQLQQQLNLLTQSENQLLKTRAHQVLKWQKQIQQGEL